MIKNKIAKKKAFIFAAASMALLVGGVVYGVASRDVAKNDSALKPNNTPKVEDKVAEKEDDDELEFISNDEKVEEEQNTNGSAEETKNESTEKVVAKNENTSKENQRVENTNITNNKNTESNSVVNKPSTGNSNNNESSKPNTGNSNTNAPSNPNNGGSTNKPSKPNNGGGNNKPSTPEKPAHTHSWNPVTTTINHKEQGHYETVVVKPGWTETKPKYETQERSICSTCDEDITGRTTAHIKAHMLNGENGSFHTEWRQVQVGTETINHPAVTEKKWIVDKAAWTETVTTGYKCSGCGATK